MEGRYFKKVNDDWALDFFNVGVGEIYILCRASLFLQWPRKCGGYQRSYAGFCVGVGFLGDQAFL